ncbi:unnamed protein product [Trichogramma brassicae]|uniref:Uncharacterized protein n=1 Tax=Trichogramma brassicae TaxID=86971 RepID=A0A6H5I7Z8_9HYME|nr:unnamed protein product [Trichogramma brassicae]
MLRHPRCVSDRIYASEPRYHELILAAVYSTLRKSCRPRRQGRRRVRVREKTVAGGRGAALGKGQQHHRNHGGDADFLAERVYPERPQAAGRRVRERLGAAAGTAPAAPPAPPSPAAAATAAATAAA